MTAFHDFLRQRLASGGFTTEDALVSFLPLLQQVLDAHDRGCVAPLEGLDALHVEAARIYFEERQLRPPRPAGRAVQVLDPARRGAVEVVGALHRHGEVVEGTVELEDLTVAMAGTEVERPVYIPGYVSWEHAVDCHDPLSDVFSLGLILASLACGLDLSDPQDLRRFVRHRTNLFALNGGLHPVVAKAIVRMTELSRHHRLQDLVSLARALGNHRDQETDLDFDLLRVEGFAQRPRHDRQQIILERLRERLFEISRSNRLLQFRPTMRSVNLTHASVPLSFDVRRIRAEQVLTWSGSFRAEVRAERPISLNRYLDFREVPYLGGALDRVRTEARRDQAEFGFQPLRLVPCFLNWTDLKDPQKPRYHSPLVLLPVALTRKKGVRDTHWITPVGTEAEINPVVRHLFKTLYDVDLPEMIDLAEVDLADFHQALKARIQASEPAVELERIECPRIDVIYDLARRRLDQYARRARLAGKGVRRYRNLDYSYDPLNYHPLGIRLFNALLRPPETRLQRIIEERPRPRRHAAPVGPSILAPAATRQRQLYALREDDGGNPYAWSFDLCSVTLGNFKYRKMSLVRDYAQLLDEPRDNAAFEATFSLAPREVIDDREQPPLPLEERFHVVPCDSTQASAIALARGKRSYIVQGPPGTGKSQTITNLIADAVAAGRRVLFVCEKRAAIDVVYHRLRERGLGSLACLIHDSQADKKQFVMDLRQTYESFLEDGRERPDEWAAARGELLAGVHRDLQPLDRYDRAMRAETPDAGLPLHRLLLRAVALADRDPGLSDAQRERLPPYADWSRHTEAIERLVETIGLLRDDGVFARHPLARLAAPLADADRPLNRVLELLARARDGIAATTAALRRAGAPPEAWPTVDEARRLAGLARALLGLARGGHIDLLDPEADASRRFARLVARHETRRRAADDAVAATAGWREVLPEPEVTIALARARLLEGRLLSVLKPAWWRLRKALRRAYDFDAHAVRPPWTLVLEQLLARYAAQRHVEALADEARAEFGFKGTLGAFIDEVEALRRRATQAPDPHRALVEAWVRDDDGPARVEVAAEAVAPVAALEEALGALLDDGEEPRELAMLPTTLDAVEGALDDLPDVLACLREMSRLPGALAHVFRREELSAPQIEAAIARRTTDEALRAAHDVRRLTAAARTARLQRLDGAVHRWQEVNAHAVRERVCQAFLQRVHLSTQPAAHLDTEQQEFKKRYARGRRELEHEFGKSMRYKPIRELAAGDTGLVVRDLKPVWLMSPLSVSDTLPLDADRFDLVVFDEASQITLEEAIPSVFRAEQAIVVGDEMQLPPTNFFSARRDGEEDDLWIEQEGERVAYDLSSSSFLNHAAKNLASRMLGWHYRSRSEALISFSNWAFYDGRLLTVPDERRAATRRPALRAASAEDGATNAAAVLERPVSFHFVERAVYEKRRNRAEADYIAHLVRGLLSAGSGRSIGIVAFSEAQQDEIEGALDRLAGEDDDFRDALDAELERERDDQFVGLLIKNLENIQGDERDIVIMSVCYGPDALGAMRMNFGPINQSGGEKRLNVAFSRARHHMVLVSSIHDHQITNDYNDGASCLRRYLRYASAVSVGDEDNAARVLRELSVLRPDDSASDAPANHPVADAIAAALRRRGWAVDVAIGRSRFRCDLGVYRSGDEIYRAGVLVDRYDDDDGGGEGRAALLERHLTRPALLRAFGWTVITVLTRDWYEDSQRELRRIERVLGGEDDPVDEEARAVDLEEPWVAGAPEDEPPPAPDADHQDPARRDERAAPPVRVKTGATRRFECVTKSSRKFWEITVVGARHSVRFGRIGTRGREQVRDFDTAKAAREDAAKRIRAKLGKGYVERPPD